MVRILNNFVIKQVLNIPFPSLHFIGELDVGRLVTSGMRLVVAGEKDTLLNTGHLGVALAFIHREKRDRNSRTE